MSEERLVHDPSVTKSPKLYGGLVDPRVVKSENLRHPDATPDRQSKTVEGPLRPRRPDGDTRRFEGEP